MNWNQKNHINRADVAAQILDNPWFRAPLQRARCDKSLTMMYIGHDSRNARCQASILKK